MDPLIENIDVLRTRTGEKWSLFADDVLPAWVADMDFSVAEPIRRAVQLALETGDLGYPVNPTPGGLPSVFADRARQRFDWTVDPTRIEVITDVVQGLYIALEVYSEPGEGAIIQTPVYPPFLEATAQTQRRTILNPLLQTTAGFEIDFDALRAAIDPQTRLLLLCNPQNPTGRMFTAAELQTLGEIAIERDLIVVSDEIHSDLAYDGRRHLPLAALSPEIERRCVTITSATKAFNIAGLRCGVAVFGSEELQRRFNSIPRRTRGGLSSLGLEATRVAWQECDDWLEGVVSYLQANRDLVAEFLRTELPRIRHRPPEATYLAWLDCRELDLPGGPQRHFLKRAKVALSDGRSFGADGVGFVRLNFATSRKILTELLERMAKSL